MNKRFSARRPVGAASAWRVGLMIGLIGAALSFRPANAEETARKIVVELFTSQGCRSCPPADAYLGELAERDDVIALALHVDYWDYLGWRDPYGQRAFSERQRGYMRMLGGQGRGVTPHMVIQGNVGVVGAHRNVVNLAITRLSSEPDLVEIRLSCEGDQLTIDLRPATSAAYGSGAFEVAVAGYDGPFSIAIHGGENEGREILYHNVVRDLQVVGAWSGGETTLTATIDPDLVGYAVLVQYPGPGRVVGAEKIELTRD